MIHALVVVVHIAEPPLVTHEAFKFRRPHLYQSAPPAACRRRASHEPAGWAHDEGADDGPDNELRIFRADVEFEAFEEDVAV